MMTHARILGIVAALGLWWLAGAGSAADNQPLGWQPVLDEADAMTLIKKSTRLIQEEVKTPKQGKELRKSNKRIQVLAVEIAAIAQSAKGGANRQLLATVRDDAVALAKEAGDKADMANMKKLAQALASGKVSAKARAAVVSLRPYLDDQGDVMLPFKALAKGGDGLDKSLQDNPRLRMASQNGIEEKVRNLARRPLTATNMTKEAADLTLMADKIAALAQVNKEWVPAKKEGKRDPKDWLAWSDDMRKQAVDLAAAARTGNANGVFKAAQKLNSTCTRCHGIFKPE